MRNPGALGTLLAITLVGMGKSGGGSKGLSPSQPLTARWKACLIFGGAFSGVSFMTQAYVGTFDPTMEKGFLFAGTGFGLSAVILLATLAKELPALGRSREIIAGAGVGLANTLCIPLTMKAYSCFPPEIVLPVTVVTPMAFNLIIARLAYREHLARIVWTGCIMAIISVAAIAYGSKLK